MDDLEKWEYMTTVLVANIEKPGAKEYFSKRWPDWRKPPKYPVQSVIVDLDRLGEEGWELVHMQPTVLDESEGFLGHSDWYTNTYFCVFKRRKRN